MNQTREFDVVIWGASGFTGKLVAEYLYMKYSSNRDLKWAIAGRDFSKLELIRTEVADTKVPIIIADSNDMVSLNNMTKRTKVINIISPSIVRILIIRRCFISCKFNSKLLNRLYCTSQSQICRFIGSVHSI